MKLILIAFLLFVLHETSADRKVGKPINVDVNVMCYNGACPADQVCRVLDKCKPNRRTRSKCFNCVPPGIDKVCNDKGYLRAVLSSPLRNPKPVYCRLGGDPDKFMCPEGSDCVENPDTPGFGQCCYGATNTPLHLLPVSNNDAQCSHCNPPCQNGYDCVNDVMCGLMDHECRPQVKPGFCPAYALTPGYVCTNPEKRRYCENDQDCPGVKKCCENACGGSTCIG